MGNPLPILDDRPSPPTDAPGPVERALDDAFSIARARLWRPGARVQSFRLWRRFHLELLDLSKVKIKVPRGQVPDCEACTELCCTGENARVSLRLRDVARLMDAGHASHIKKEPTLDDGATARKKGWARREADSSVFHRVFPVLARDATSTCTFLTEDRLCGAYPAWPLSCARYPYALDLQLRVIFYAKGCGSSMLLPPDEAPLRVRALARAVLDSYNERVRDVVTLALAPDLLARAGLLPHLALEHWPLPVDAKPKAAT